MRKWHDLSLLDFCRNNLKLGNSLIDYLVQPFSSFAYVEPDELSADYGLFLLSYSVTPCAAIRKGMGEVALRIKNSLPETVAVNSRVSKVTYEASKGFMIEQAGKEGDGTGKPRMEGPYAYCIFATGRRNVKYLMADIDFAVFGSKTRGFIFETVAPRYRPFELLIFPKAGNTDDHHWLAFRRLELNQKEL